MKVVMLASRTDVIGGIEQYNRNVRAGIEEGGAELHWVQLNGADLPSKAGFVLRAAWALLTKRPDVVWCAHVGFSVVCGFLCWLLRLRYVVALYGIEVIRIDPLKRFALARAWRLTPIAEHTRDNLLRNVPGVESRVRILPNSVDGARFDVREKPQSLLARHGLENQRVVLTVARLNPGEEKGYHRVVRALPGVLREIPNVRYVVVGKGADPRLDEAVAGARLEAAVVRPGPATDEDLPLWYNAADLFVMPSKNEGFAIVFLEALASGTPVISSAGYGCAEALLHGELGLSVDPDDPGALASAIVGMLRNLPDRFRDRTALRRTALAVYDVATFKKRVFDVVSGL